MRTVDGIYASAKIFSKTVEDYAIAINKENTELLEKINGALAELSAEGKLDEIIEKYIPVE